jgi:DNA-directed RNA polymerase specialized sigma subunit
LALQSEAIRTLRAARQTCLTERERELLDLLLTEMNDKEIAAVLGKSHGAVRTAHWRLVAKLRDCLSTATGTSDVGRTDG